MAKTPPVKLITRTPIGNALEITMKRWFQTREFWLNLAGWLATVLPIASTMIGQLPLSAISLFVWTMVIQSILFAANQFLKNTSKSVVVSGDQLRDEHQASQEPNWDASTGGEQR